MCPLEPRAACWSRRGRTARCLFATRRGACRLRLRSASGLDPQPGRIGRRLRPGRPIPLIGKRCSAHSVRFWERLETNPARAVALNARPLAGSSVAAITLRVDAVAIWNPNTRSPGSDGDRPLRGWARGQAARRAPPPSVAMPYQLSAPERADMKTMPRPSGLHSGSPSIPGLKVRRLWTARARSRIQISVSP